jgi:hypothetical protein
MSTTAHTTWRYHCSVENALITEIKTGIVAPTVCKNSGHALTADSVALITSETDIVRTGAPASTDDYSKGFYVGDLWKDESSGIVYVLKTSTLGAAVWKDITTDIAPSTFNASQITFTGTGDALICSQDTTKFREGSQSTLTSGAVYTLFGEKVMKYWTHNVSINSSGNFLGCDGNGPCTIIAFTESGNQTRYDCPTTTAGQVPGVAFAWVKGVSQTPITLEFNRNGDEIVISNDVSKYRIGSWATGSILSDVYVLFQNYVMKYESHNCPVDPVTGNFLACEDNGPCTIVGTTKDNLTIRFDSFTTTAGQIPGSVSYPWVKAVGYSIPYENVLYVAKNGNNTTKTPYLTIGAALTDAVSGQIVMVYPGTYAETSLTIPSGVTLKGFSRDSCILQYTATTTTTMITVGGANVSIEDIQLKLLSTTATGVNLTLVSVTGTNNGTFRLFNSRLEISNGTTTSSNVYCINNTGTGIVPTDIDVNVRNCKLIVTSNGTGIKRCVVNSGVDLYFDSCGFSCKNVSTGTDYIALETTSAGAELFLSNCAIEATTANISQTSGSIRMTKSTALIDGTANGLSFSSVNLPLQIGWGNVGNLTTGSNRYFYRGSATASASIVNYYVSNPCVVFAMYASADTASAGNCVFTLFKNGVATTMTVTVTSPALFNSNTTQSISFPAGSTMALRALASTGIWSNVDVSLSVW